MTAAAKARPAGALSRRHRPADRRSGVRGPNGATSARGSSTCSRTSARATSCAMSRAGPTRPAGTARGPAQGQGRRARTDGVLAGGRRVVQRRLRVSHRVAPSRARLASIQPVAQTHAGSRNSRAMVAASDGPRPPGTARGCRRPRSARPGWRAGSGRSATAHGHAVRAGQTRSARRPTRAPPRRRTGCASRRRAVREQSSPPMPSRIEVGPARDPRRGHQQAPHRLPPPR